MPRTTACPRRCRGLTLLECVASVAVLGVVAVVALPAHRAYAIKAHRADAMRDLRDLSGALDRCFARTGSYADTSCSIEINGGITAAEGTYATTAEISGQAYLLKATPINAQTADTRCRVLTIDNKGNRGISGGSLTAEDCWRVAAD